MLHSSLRYFNSEHHSHKPAKAPFIHKFQISLSLSLPHRTSSPKPFSCDGGPFLLKTLADANASVLEKELDTAIANLGAAVEMVSDGEDYVRVLVVLSVTVGGG
ncbi:hypothetical protein Droror1_Dr00012044 [Drosera rotundifolia]